MSFNAFEILHYLRFILCTNTRQDGAAGTEGNLSTCQIQNGVALAHARLDKDAFDPIVKILLLLGVTLAEKM